MKSVLTVIGTRPEAIKLAPVVRELERHPNFISKVLLTRQHKELLDPYLGRWGIHADYQFSYRECDGSLHQSAGTMLQQFGFLLAEAKFDLMIVQGDTTTAFIAALAAFYARIPVAHVEAGLRTGEVSSPWPEEAHRRLADHLSTYFFAPTERARQRLLEEGAPPQRVHVVGNTSIDAIRTERCRRTSPRERLIVVTVHRRENHGAPLLEICRALRTVAERNPDVRIAFHLHPNRAVRKPALLMLSGLSNVDLIEPSCHSTFIHLLDRALFAITDSGGIQEEAPFLGKALLVTRTFTERPEGVEAGTARLVGADRRKIIDSCQELLENPETLAAMSHVHHPYGDGYASERIVKILDREMVEACA